MTLRFDLRLNQGETFRLAVPVIDEDGNPVSLSGMTARGQIRSHAASPAALYEWSASAGNLALDGNDVVLTVPPATSSAWTWRSASWDVELTDNAGVVTRLIEGLVIVYPEVTR